ncbi:hypothetical protein D3C87_931590 [compost metagenome]
MRIDEIEKRFKYYKDEYEMPKDLSSDIEFLISEVKRLQESMDRAADMLPYHHNAYIMLQDALLNR